MKKLIIAALSAFVAVSALATPEKPPKAQKPKQPIVINTPVSVKVDAPAPAAKDLTTGSGTAPQTQIQQGVLDTKVDASSKVEFKAGPGSIYAVASSPSPTTCDGAGISIGGGGSKGNALVNFGVGERESCLGAQDANSMKAAGFSEEDIQRRLCQVSTIGKAAKRCQTFANESRQAGSVPSVPVATVGEPSDPFVRARLGLAPL